MTCIVGIAEKGIVTIGADAASVGAGIINKTKLPKVFLNGKFLIGYTSSFRMGQILQHHLEVERQGKESIEAYMVKTFAEAVRKSLKEHGCTKVDNNTETAGTFLVGYHGRLFAVYSDLQVNEAAERVDACGSGEKFALGSLYATRGMDTPDFRIRTALKAAANYSTGVCPPFKVLAI